MADIEESGRKGMSRWAGGALCAASAAGFGTLAILAKLAFAADLEMWTILAWRFAGGAAALSGLLALSRRRSLFPDTRRVLTWLTLGGVGYAVQATLFFSGVQRIPASVAVVLLYLYPVLVALLAWAVEHRPPLRREWLAMMLAMGGVALTVGLLSPSDRPQEPLDPVGIAFALGSAGWYSGYILVSERALRGSDPWVATGWILLGASVTFCVIAIPQGLWPNALTARPALILGAMIVFSTILPIGTFLAGMKRVGSTAASLISTLEPVFTVALAWLVLGEGLSPGQAAGAALVLTAVILLYLPASPPTHATATG